MPHIDLRIVAYIVLLPLAAWGQLSARPSSAPFPRFALSEGKLDQYGLPVSGAKLCLLARRDICHTMPSNDASASGQVTYEFGLDPRSERLPLVSGGSWVFFSAQFSGGGSGTLDRLAVLRYEPNAQGGKIVDLLPFAGVTNISDRAMWTLPVVSPYPILVVADFIWGDGETHFARHFYDVRAWRFDPNTDRYVEAFSYRTGKKYGGGDVAPVRVLALERPEILRRLEEKWRGALPNPLASLSFTTPPRGAFSWKRGPISGSNAVSARARLFQPKCDKWRRA